MLWDWLKKDFAKDVAFVKELGASLSAGRGVSIPTREESPAGSHALMVAAVGLMALVLTPTKRTSDDFINGQGWPDPIKLGSLDIDPFRTGYWSTEDV